MFHIGNIYIYALVPIIFWFWYFLWKEKIWHLNINPIFAKYTKTPFFKKCILLVRFLLIFFIVSILAGVQILYSHEKVTEKQQNIMIILDISRSMLAEDISPSRIAVAKNTLKEFLQSRNNDNIWLIIFAGKPFQLISTSRDTSGMETIIESLSPNSIRQEIPGLSGTNIGDAILLANTELEKQQNTSIILLTDGSANIGNNPEESAKLSHQKNIKIFTIGIGAKTNQPLSYTDQNGHTQYFYDEKGERIYGDIDELQLQKIANITWWAYFSVENAGALQQALENTDEKIGNIKHTEIVTQNISLTPIFAWIVILLVVIENFLRKKFYRKYAIIS